MARILSCYSLEGIALSNRRSLAWKYVISPAGHNASLLELTVMVTLYAIYPLLQGQSPVTIDAIREMDHCWTEILISSNLPQ